MKYLLSLIFILGSFARAEETSTAAIRDKLRFFEVELDGGTAQLTGQFSSENRANPFGLSINIYQPTLYSPQPRGYFFIDLSNYTVTSKDSNWPFVVGKTVSFTSDTLGVMVSVYRNDYWNFFLGVGSSLIDVIGNSTTRYEQTYGSASYFFKVRYKLNNDWSLNLKSSWQQMAQTVNDQNSFIEVWSNFIGVGYMIF